jgi:hypothetical protein
MQAEPVVNKPPDTLGTKGEALEDEIRNNKAL